MVVGLDVNRVRLAWLLTGLFISLALIYVIWSFIGTFVFGLFFYYATRPVYERVHKRVENRIIAASASMLLMALPIVVLMGYLLLIGIQELDALSRQFQSVDPELYRQYVSPYINASQAVQDPRMLLENPEAVDFDLIQEVFNQGLGYLGFFLNAGLHTFVMILLGYYLLKDGRTLSRWFQTKFADDRGVLEEFVRQVDSDFERIFFGNILNAILTAIVGATVFTLVDVFLAPPELGVPASILMGLLAGAASLLPLLGLKLVYLPLTAYIAFDAYQTDPTLLWFPAVFFLLAFVFVDLGPEFVIRPYVSGRSLHIGAVILAYTFGPLLWGWYGLFLGPMILILAYHFGRVVVPEIISQRTYAPFSVDPSTMEEVAPTREAWPPDDHEDDGELTPVPPAEAEPPDDDPGPGQPEPDGQ